MHLAKSPQPYSMSTPACSFVLSEITGTAGNRDEKKKQVRRGSRSIQQVLAHYIIL